MKGEGGRRPWQAVRPLVSGAGNSAWLTFPDAFVVGEDGAVAREEAAAGCVEHAHALPALLVLVNLVNQILHAVPGEPAFSSYAWSSRAMLSRWLPSGYQLVVPLWALKA